MKQDTMIERARELNATTLYNLEDESVTVNIIAGGGSLEMVIGARGAIKRWSSAGNIQLAKDIVFFIQTGHVSNNIKELL